MTYRRTAASFAWLVVLATFAAHGTDAVSPSKTLAAQAVSRISGSLMQINRVSAVASPSVQAVASVPGDPDRIAAVCITSGASLERCGASPLPTTAAATGCGDSGQYQSDGGAIAEPASWCHGRTEPTYAHAPHVAVCDADEAGLAGCLGKYASALVKHPDEAKYVYQFDINQREQPAITVLITAKQTERDAQQMALSSITGTTVASTH